MTKVYLHQYALSSGKIMEVEGELVPGGIRKSGILTNEFFAASSYSPTFEEAVKIANIKRFKRIESLEKQIKKLKALNFEK